MINILQSTVLSPQITIHWWSASLSLSIARSEYVLGISYGPFRVR